MPKFCFSRPIYHLLFNKIERFTANAMINSKNLQININTAFKYIFFIRLISKIILKKINNHTRYLNTYHNTYCTVLNKIFKKCISFKIK